MSDPIPSAVCVNLSNPQKSPKKQLQFGQGDVQELVQDHSS